ILPFVGLLLLGYMCWRIGPERIVSLVAATRLNLLIMVAIYGCHECVRAIALSRCLPVENRPSFLRLLRIRFQGEAMGTVTNTGLLGAEPARAWLLGQDEESGSHAYAAAIGELIANNWMSALVTTVALISVQRRFASVGSIALLSRGLIVFCTVYLCGMASV